MGIQRVREMERDDFSSFPHSSYARMYAIDYAKYLGIPISRVRRMLPEAGEQGWGGHQYLQEKACDYMRTDFTSPRRRLAAKARRGRPPGSRWPWRIQVLDYVA